MSDKKLALAFQFENAPQEVKDVAAEHRENYLAMITAEQQVILWNRDKIITRRKFEQTARRFERALSQWDPAGLKAQELKKAERVEGESSGFTFNMV
jgi:acetylornithine/succinyldiaminopimelate/putrescine aminotransferase